MGTPTHPKDRFIMIGHSGGGVAAYRGFQSLMGLGDNLFSVNLTRTQIITVGSPRMLMTNYKQLVHALRSPFDPIPAWGFWIDNHDYDPFDKDYVAISSEKSITDPMRLLDIHSGYFLPDKNLNNTLQDIDRIIPD